MCLNNVKLFFFHVISEKKSRNKKQQQAIYSHTLYELTNPPENTETAGDLNLCL